MGTAVTTGFLLDTNHISRAVIPRSPVRQRITDLRQRGIKIGTCVPVLCEIEAGIQQVAQPDVYRLNLERLLRQIRVWPIDPSTARKERGSSHLLPPFFSIQGGQDSEAQSAK